MESEVRKPPPDRALKVTDLGLCDYARAYDRQREWVARLQKHPEAPDQLLLVEHPEVYTFGRRSRDPIPQDLPNPFAIERGGEATYHNPGQLVAYPILRLAEGERDLHAYLRRLEEGLILLLGHFGLPAGRRDGATGVWVAEGTRKIASIGVAVSRWVTYHGIALNVNNDLSGFARISPCGFSSSVMTSLQAELGSEAPGMEEVKRVYVEIFARVFGRNAESAGGLLKPRDRRVD